MKVEEDLLNEYYNLSSKKSRLYNLLIVLIFAFIGILNFAIYDSGRLYFDWLNIFLGVIIPGTGLGLLFFKKKAGWFISAVYYSFLTCIFLSTIAKWGFADSNYSPNTLVGIKQFLFSGLAAILTILLWSNDIRRHLQIRPWLWIIAILFSLLISFTTIFTLI